MVVLGSLLESCFFLQIPALDDSFGKPVVGRSEHSLDLFGRA